MLTSLLTVDPDITSTITTGFAAVTTVILAVIGLAFALVATVVGAKAGISWIRRVGQH